MLSLCSSLSISFNSAKHFHLYGSNASLAQVCLCILRSSGNRGQQRGLRSPRAELEELEGEVGEPRGRSGLGTRRASVLSELSALVKGLVEAGSSPPPLVGKQTIGGDQLDGSSAKGAHPTPTLSMMGKRSKQSESRA